MSEPRGPVIDIDAIARLIWATETEERRKQIPGEPLYSWEGLPEGSRELNRTIAGAVVEHRDAQWQQRLTTLEAALARTEGNLTTACILIGNLLSSDDEADVAAGRAFIDAMVAGRERTPTSAGAAGEEDDRDV